MSALKLNAPLTVMPNVNIQETLELLNKEGFDQVPVVDEEGLVSPFHINSLFLPVERSAV